MALLLQKTPSSCCFVFLRSTFWKDFKQALIVSKHNILSFALNKRQDKNGMCWVFPYEIQDVQTQYLVLGKLTVWQI